MPIQQEAIERAIVIAKEFGATRLVLFGSGAASLEHASDLDLAVDGVPGWKLYELSARLEDELRIPLVLMPLDPPIRFTRMTEQQGKNLL